MNNWVNKICEALIEGNFCKKVINKIDYTLSRICRKFVSINTPIKNNKIIFMTYQNDYVCNLKYIAEEIIRQKLPYDLVWAVKKKSNKKENFPINIRLVERNSVEFFKEAISAKIWIDNALNFAYENLPKKKEQILINTWHGSMGLKRIGQNDNKNEKWVKNALRCNKDTNYCISDSDFETNVYRETYWKDTPILKYGHPRNDILLKISKEDYDKIKRKVYCKLNIDTEKKVLLYAPTFRDDKNIDCYNIDYHKLIDALKIRFGGEWIILARHHFHLWNNKNARESIDNIKDVIKATDYDDMQELMLIADIGITDYSSWICDFVLTKKPGFIFATDLEKYNNERGLYYPLETTPFPIAKNNNELINNIMCFDEKIYEEKRKKFLLDRGCFETGQASKKVVEKIKKIIGEVNK